VIRQAIAAPLVAIGGITAENAGDAIRAGADGVAVVSAVCGASDPAEATRRLLERIRPSLTARDKRL
jgi:thiamine-phosphate pyrophosphorylase